MCRYPVPDKKLLIKCTDTKKIHGYLPKSEVDYRVSA